MCFTTDDDDVEDVMAADGAEDCVGVMACRCWRGEALLGRLLSWLWFTLAFVVLLLLLLRPCVYDLERVSVFILYAAAVQVRMVGVRYFINIYVVRLYNNVSTCIPMHL